MRDRNAVLVKIPMNVLNVSVRRIRRSRRPVIRHHDLPGSDANHIPHEGVHTVFVVPVGLFQMGDCSLIVFKDAEEIEILPKSGAARAATLCVRLDKNIHHHSAAPPLRQRWSTRCYGHLGRRGPEEARSEGKSASHLPWLGVGSRNAVIGKASRIGINFRAGAPPARNAPRAARSQWPSALYSANAQSSGAAALAIPSSAGGRWRWGGFGPRSRDAKLRTRDSRLRLPVAAGRSRKRSFAYCVHAGQGQSYCAGAEALSVGAAHDAPERRGSEPSGVRGGCREAALNGLRSGGRSQLRRRAR
jgi:hypothetical protein